MDTKLKLVCERIDDMLGYAENIIYGFADLSDDKYLHPSYPYLGKCVVIGVSLSKSSVSDLLNGISQEYIDECYRANAELDVLAVQVQDILEDGGYRAKALLSSTSDYDPITYRTDFSHKRAATKAGLGWIGMSGLLVTKKIGSALRLNTVLTDAPLSTDNEPVRVSECGDCVACMKHCPSNSIKGVLWDRSLDRDDLIDVKSCYNECVDAASKVNFEYPLCGKCITSCPFTLKYTQR